MAGPGVAIQGLSNSATGIVSPFITAGNDSANVGGDGRITTWSGYSTDINSGSSSDHVKLNSGGTTTLAADVSRASLNLQNSNAAVGQVLDLNGRSLAITTGGILSSGAGANLISNGQLSTTAGELVVTANNNLTISSSILDISGTTLTKSGSGTLTLSGTNTYSGPTVITQGTLIASSDANLGSGATIELNGGTLKAAASFSSIKALTTDSGLAGAVDTAGFNLTFSGADNAGFSKVGSGTLTLSAQRQHRLMLTRSSCTSEWKLGLHNPVRRHIASGRNVVVASN